MIELKNKILFITGGEIMQEQGCIIWVRTKERILPHIDLNYAQALDNMGKLEKYLKKL